MDVNNNIERVHNTHRPRPAACMMCVTPASPRYLYRARTPGRSGRGERGIPYEPTSSQPGRCGRRQLVEDADILERGKQPTVMPTPATVATVVRRRHRHSTHFAALSTSAVVLAFAVAGNSFSLGKLSAHPTIARQAGGGRRCVVLRLASTPAPRSDDALDEHRPPRPPPPTTLVEGGRGGGHYHCSTAISRCRPSSSHPSSTFWASR